MRAATIQLAHLISTNQPVSGPWQQFETYEFYPKNMGFLDEQIVDLLAKGADINIAVCIYRNHHRTLYRLIGSNPVMDALYHQRSGLFISADDMWNLLEPKHITVIVSPLIDAAAQDNEYATYLFSNLGARFETVLERLSVCRIPIEKLSNPFSGNRIPYSKLITHSILDLANPKHPVVQNWVHEALKNYMPGINHHSAVTLLRQTDSVSKSLRAIIGPSYADQTMPATISTSEPGFLRVVFLGNVDLCARVPRDQSGQTARGPHGITPLMIAVGNASTAVCEHLLDCGANPNEYDDFGMTALMDAIQYGHEEAVDLLLAHGAETNRAKPGSMFPSHTAPKHPLVWEDEWLIQRNTFAKTCMEKGWYTLHLAAHKGRLKALQSLCNAGAHLAALDAIGNSALDIAMLESQDIAAYYLLSHNCPFNTRSPAASRLLIQAIADREHDLVSQLLESGVPPLPVSGLEVEAYEVEMLHFTKERSVKLLSERIPKPDPLSNYVESAPELCVDCSTSLETAKFSLAPYPDPNCKLCQLLADCSDNTGNLPATMFSINDDARDGELTTVSTESTLRHPLKTVPDNWHTIFERLKVYRDDDTSSPAAITMASSWLRLCIDGHSHCSCSRNSHYFPTRVLDLDGVSNGQSTKLLQNADLHEPYLALSHRWGSKGLPVTTLENLAGRLEKIDLAELSQILRDAIQIVLGLGYRYLWIDALCIIQDSADDWLFEASKMSSVFSGAVVTIAVADAEDQSQGIFRKRPTRCMRPFHVPWMRGIPHRDRMHIDGEAKYYIFPKTNLVGGGTRTKGTLDTRGWVLQEQLLSTRILYYDKGEIYWDCVTLSASESSPISASLLEVTNPDEIWALKLIRRTLAGAINDVILRTSISDAWLEIIKNYSARVLTRHNDRLIALEGIIVPLKAILRENPVAGMWRENLWLQLTWWMQAPDSSANITIGFPAPSWSWLSVRKRIYYHNSLLGEQPEQNAVTHKFTDLRAFHFLINHVQSEQLRGTSGIIGTMTVSAKTFLYRLTKNDLKKPVYKRWNQAKLKLNTGRWLLDAPVQLPLDIHCLIIAEDQVAKLLVCLCIVPDEEQKDKWRRIGLCHWDGLEWQVQSFVGTEPETRTFTLL